MNKNTIITDVLFISTIDGTVNIIDLCTFSIINFVKSPNIITDMLILNLESLDFPFKEKVMSETIDDSSSKHNRIKLIIASKDKLVRI